MTDDNLKPDLSLLNKSECHAILVGLKATVEGLLANQSSYVWNTYGGLNRLSAHVERTLNHRLRISQGVCDFWHFINALRRLQPTCSPLMTSLERKYTSDIQMMGLQWLHHNLYSLSLSSKLQILIQDTDHLTSCYDEGAFLRDSNYAQSLVTCLKAVEENNPALLAELDPNLLIRQASNVSSSCSDDCDLCPEILADPWSYLETNESSFDPLLNQQCQVIEKHPLLHKSMSVDSSLMKYGMKKLRRRGQSLDENYRTVTMVTNPTNVESDPLNVVDDDEFNCDSDGEGIEIDNGSCDNDENAKEEAKCDTSCAQPKSPTIAIKKSSHARSKSDVVNNDELLKELSIDEPDGVSLSSSLPSNLPVSQRRHSLLEEGGSSIATKTECFFPQPTEGQSLTSFLSSQVFHTCPELDRENAHFSISEALISAIAQIKWDQSTVKAPEEDDESDEEIAELKQRIRIRRRERQIEKKQSRNTINLLSDGCSDTTTPIATPQTSPSDNSDSADTSDDIDELEYSDDEKNVSKLSSLSENGLSLSMASLYSDADIHKTQPSFTSAIRRASTPKLDHSIKSNSSLPDSSILSAETVALSLLKQFSEKQLPKASDLQWLVSEEDAPQRLLPLPNSWPVSPDDPIEDQKPTRLRGNMNWAPPRAQIIFNIHAAPNRKIIMAKQNYRCAGCGMRTEKSYIKRFRFCNYLGKYFCQCCHNNATSIIPGRVLRKWDFSKYPVSTFSNDLIQKMWHDPLFNISDINPTIYRKAKQLDALKDLRLQLSYLREFLHTCRLGSELQVELSSLPLYLITEPHQYSLNDLLQVKCGDLVGRIRQFVVKALEHVQQCPLCQAKGFICEFCRDNQHILFPFHIKAVLQCSGCYSCFHKTCFIPDKCPKCARIAARKQKQLEDEQKWQQDNDED